MIGEFKDHFSERASGYAAYRPRYPRALAVYLASQSPARARAWDAGCGSGQLSTLLGEHFNRVIASDASEAQIERAARHANVDYVVARAEETSIADESMDLIVAAQAAHWFDLAHFYKEVRRVGKRDGAVALLGYGVTEVEPEIRGVVDHFYGSVLAPYWPPERKHIESGYRELNFPFVELDPPEMEMVVEWSLDQMLGYVSTWSAVRALEASEGTEKTAKFTDALRSDWGNRSVRPVRWQIQIRIGRVSAGRS
jgi:SAM-dependent methyltransferase